MTTVYGWWDWDADVPGLVNRVTGERMVFRGEFRDPDLVPQDKTWLRFDYLHSELAFPLLVEQRQSEEQQDKGKTSWRVDYPRSSALWRRETGAQAHQPSYGVWRRVDDCASDAFACWPENAAPHGAFARDFWLTGAWLNGVWRETFDRSERRCSVRLEKAPPQREYSSWLVSLDASPPSPFVFHDHIPRRNGTENWEVENPVLPAGLTFENAQFRRGPKWPAGTPLNVLAGRTAYLLAKDEKRLLYPFYGDTEEDRGRGHWTPRFSLLYVDEKVAQTCSARPGDRSQGGAAWHLFQRNDCVFRRSDLDPAFFVAKERHPPIPYPSRPLWLHGRWALIDGWSCWQGSKAWHSAWFSYMRLLRTTALRVSGGYQGGVWGNSLGMFSPRVSFN